MTFYHSTDFLTAGKIVKEGFRDSTGFYGLSSPLTGVFVSDEALDANEGADGEAVLRIEMPEDLVAPFEIIEDKGWREWCVPSEIVNQYFTDKHIYDLGQV